VLADSILVLYIWCAGFIANAIDPEYTLEVLIVILTAAIVTAESSNSEASGILNSSFKVLEGPVDLYGSFCT
jgi:hypothetical protein